MDELTGIIERATALIEEEYMRLPIDGGLPAYRERVYCYELYHRVRCLWPPKCRFTLSGEVAKRGHPLMAKLGLAQIPDLLVHQPGRMAGNHTVIEVKHVEGASLGLFKDLQTLSAFQRLADYRRGILLVYGTDGETQLLGTIEGLYAELADPAEVEVWFHGRAGEAARCMVVLSPGGGRGPRARPAPGSTRTT